MHQFSPFEGLILNSNMVQVRRVKKLNAAPSSQGRAHPNTLGLVFQSWQVPWFHSLSWLSKAAVIRPVGSCNVASTDPRVTIWGLSGLLPQIKSTACHGASVLSSTKWYVRNNFKIGDWPIETIRLFTLERISCSEQKQLVWSRRSTLPSISLPGFNITAADADTVRSRRGKIALLQSCYAADEWLFLLNKPIQASAPQPFTWWVWTIMNQD